LVAAVLRLLHLGGLLAWAATALWVHARLWRGRHDPAQALRARRAVQPLLALEHGALAVGLLAGWLLMAERGWGLGYARWLAVKVGLTVFLIVPLEGIHAYVCHVWIARGLRRTEAPPPSRELARGIGMDEMIRALAVPLLGLALPLLVWLSLAKPF
jgi:hypothetical protein